MKKYIGVFLLCVSIVFFSGCRTTPPATPNTGTEGQTDGGTTDKGTTTTPETTPPGTTTTPETTTPTSGMYKDGTYTQKGDEWEHGNEDATVVIADGKMKEVTLRRLDKEGKEVDYEQWTGKEINGKVYPNLKKYREDLAKAMVDQQTYDVDTIAGATVSSDNWKLAAKRALQEAK